MDFSHLSHYTSLSTTSRTVVKYLYIATIIPYNFTPYIKQIRPGLILQKIQNLEKINKRSLKVLIFLACLAHMVTLYTSEISGCN